MKTLESLGTEQNRKVYRRHGAGENQFGVSFANLGKLHKQIRTDHAMNRALIAIGVSNARLEKPALAAAKRIGKVEVDHGETGCQTPDAAAYIRKTAEYRRNRAKKGR